MARLEIDMPDLEAGICADDGPQPRPPSPYLVWGKHATLPNTEVCLNFTSADLVVGESVVGGAGSAGDFNYGVLLGWRAGRYLQYDGAHQGSLLWSNLVLLRGAAADAARQRYRDRLAGLAPTARNRSITDAAIGGYPDADFWLRSHERPWYHCGPNSETDDKRTLAEIKAEATRLKTLLLVNDGSLTPAELVAIRNQISDMEAIYGKVLSAQSSPRSPSPSSFLGV